MKKPTTPTPDPLATARAALADHVLPPWCEPGRLAVVLHLAEPSPSNNEIKSMHFHTYKKVRTAFAAEVKAALGDMVAPGLPLSALFIVRRSAGTLDWDNAIGGLKPILDCLVQTSARNPSGLGIIVDDKPANMPYPPFMRQLPAKRGAGSTEIYVFSVDAV
jgi:hypothetical protein